MKVLPENPVSFRKLISGLLPLAPDLFLWADLLIDIFLGSIFLVLQGRLGDASEVPLT